jgi:cro/CI family transcriptional regulator
LKRNQDENINKKQVGRRIMAIRKRNFLTLIEFAEKVGASKSSISDWEQGFRLPPEAALTKIATIGNLSVDKLLYGDGNNDIEEVYQALIKLSEADILGIFRRVHNKLKFGGELEC